MIDNENLIVMLLTNNFTIGIITNRKKSCGCYHATYQMLNDLQFDNREVVNTFFDKAIAAGGKATMPAYDHGFMYGKDFEDLDGHIGEAFAMDASQMSSE